ncbi:TPA: hypothetical protein ACGSTL_001232 [Vibrio parahaemolyticus]|uniref:hypothetical protein n=1 Tax=Vibrio campbellii TaxID=680 RepID=UPI001F078A6C|nr:hypothetical protein [Vibrio campbellii]UMM06650.1 hypothetical protein MKR81_27265 [Vibrio campbellii]
MSQTTSVITLLKFHRQCVQSSIANEEMKLSQCKAPDALFKLQESLQRKNSEIQIFDSAISGIQRNDISMIKAGLELLKHRLSMSCELFQKLWDKFDSHRTNKSQQPYYMPLWEKSKSDLNLVDAQLGIC